MTADPPEQDPGRDESTPVEPTPLRPWPGTAPATPGSFDAHAAYIGAHDPDAAPTDPRPAPDAFAAPVDPSAAAAGATPWHPYRDAQVPPPGGPGARIRQLAADHAGPAAIAALVVALAYTYGGYHPRHWTLAALALALTAGVLALRGNLPAGRTPAAVTLGAGLALLAWTAASIAWAVASRHLAWDETARTVLYVAALAVGAMGFGRVEQAARLATWLGAAIGGAMLVEAARFARGGDALVAFVAGRLDAPLGYSNATAAFCLAGAWLLVGASLAATRRLRLAAAARRSPGTTWTHEARLHATGMLASPEEQHLPPWHLARACVESGLALGGATGLVACAWLAQSRGALVAGLVTVVVAFVVLPGRAALAARLAVVAGTLYAVHATLSAPFTRLTAAANAALSVDATAPGRAGAVTARAARAHADQLAARGLDSVHHAGAALLAVAAAAALFGGVVAWAGELLAATRIGRPSRTTAAIGVAVAALLVGVGAAAVVGGAGGRSPVTWAGDQVRACRDAARTAAPKPQAAAATSHFRAVGTNRCDFWRVALLDFRSHPVQGVGANNFGPTYVQHRRSTEEPRQAHSLPLSLLGELGLVGAGLGLLVLVGLGAGAVGLVRSGPWRDPAACAIVVAGAGWLVHASVDWLWNMPAATLPVVVGLGALAGCASTDARGRRAVVAPLAAGNGLGHERRSLASIAPLAIGLLIVVGATLAPQGLADRQLRAARDPQRVARHPQLAIRDAESAARWDPTWAAPLVQSAQLRLRLGDRSGAARDAAAAVRREPAQWTVLLVASQVERATGHPARAARDLRAARRRNPQLGGAKR